MRWKIGLIAGVAVFVNCSTLSNKQNLPPAHLTAFRQIASTPEEANARDAYLENFKKENNVKKKLVENLLYWYCSKALE